MGSSTIIVCNVDAELNRKLDRVASRQSLASSVSTAPSSLAPTIPALLGKRPDLGAPWALLLERVLAKEPGERFATASEMRAAVPVA